MNDLKIYLPPLYNDVLEMTSLLTAEGVVMDAASTEAENTLKDQFIQTATNYGITLFEAVLGIVPDQSTESWEYRRMRLLSRMSSNPPFTLRWLDEHLENIIGAGNYNVSLDAANYTLTVDIKLGAKMFQEEVNLFVLSAAPANLILHVQLVYRTYAELEVYTYGELTAFTHHELREEVLP